MEDANGFPNNFWGWGGEDDVLSARLRSLGVEVVRPDSSLCKEGTIVDLEDALIKKKGGIRANTKLSEGGQLAFKCMWKTELKDFHAQTGHVEGLRTLDFSLIDARRPNAHVSILTVDLKGSNDLASEKMRGGGSENVGLEVSAETTRQLMGRLLGAYGHVPPA